MTTLNTLAKTLRDLHKPQDPLVLTNIFSPATAQIALQNPRTKAIATASYAIAASQGIQDEELTLEQNIAAIKQISETVQEWNEKNGSHIPLSADLQDGYFDVIETVSKAVGVAGVVGCNLEDLKSFLPGEDREKKKGSEGRLWTKEEMCTRIRSALSAAREMQVPDFVINARTDVLAEGQGEVGGEGGTIDEAIDRGRAYLNAGATCIFIWGGSKGTGVSSEEIKRLVKELDGKVSVKMNLEEKRSSSDKSFLKLEDIRKLGVARVSVGPALWHRAMEGFRKGMEEVFGLDSME